MTFARTWLVLAAVGFAANTGMAMDRAGFNVAQVQINADYKAQNKHCKTLTSHDRDVCMKEMGERKKIALADLKARFAPSDKAAYQAGVVRADAAFAVSQEKCNERPNHSRKVCKKDAKALHVRALEDARIALIEARMADTPAARDTAVAAARKTAVVERRAMDYDAASERCKAVADDAQAQCLEDARRVYGPGKD